MSLLVHLLDISLKKQLQFSWWIAQFHEVSRSSLSLACPPSCHSESNHCFKTLNVTKAIRWRMKSPFQKSGLKFGSHTILLQHELEKYWHIWVYNTCKSMSICLYDSLRELLSSVLCFVSLLCWMFFFLIFAYNEFLRFQVLLKGKMFLS